MPTMMLHWALAATALLGTAMAAAPRPHFVFLLIDDLGFHDTQVHNPESPSPAIGVLAKEGIILQRHYVYMYCSPTRRSFLTGRFPVNINPDQSGMCDNLSPLEFTWLPEKLKAAGYQSHFVGKGHLGYTTSDHLPINRGYESHVGYLGGAEDYYQADFPGHRPVKLPGRDGLFVRNSDFWHDHAPGTDVVQDCYYSTNYYSRTAVSIVENHTASTPLFLDLRYQGVHGPYEEPPQWEQAPNSTVDPNRKCGPVSTCQTLRSMVAVVDSGIANLTLALRAKKMYDNALIIFTADNGGGMGGNEPSNNFPLRGMKGTPWDGGSRAAAFVSGGFIPAHLRGTENSAFMHVADWYPTLCVLAGVSPTDSVMFAGKIRPIDGIDAWPTLMGTSPSLGREYLPTTNQSLIYNSTWKLLVAAPSTHWFTPEDDWIEDGASLNGTASGNWSCKEKLGRNISTQGIWECMVCTDSDPCLFNLLDDPSERTNLAAQEPALVEKIRAHMPELNFSPYVQKGLPGVKLSPKINEQNYDCVWDNAGGTAKGYNASLDYWGGWFGPCCIPKGSKPPRNSPGPPLPPQPQGR